MVPPLPFVLSVSTHCPFFLVDEGQPFDELGANGWRVSRESLTTPLGDGQ